MINWLVIIVATEGIVEILVHSPLFAWLRKIGLPFFSCGWCLSVWVGGIAFLLFLSGMSWILVPFAVARMSNLFHEIFTRIRS